MQATKKPRKFRTKLSEAPFLNGDERERLETQQRQRWVFELSFLLEGTPTPAGRLLAERPETAGRVGAGRRVGTLRSRVRSCRKLAEWLLLARGKKFPTELVDFLDYALLRAADGATKSPLKSLFSSFSFLEEVAGIEEPKRVKSSSLFASAKKKLLLTRRVGRHAFGTGSRTPADKGRVAARRVEGTPWRRRANRTDAQVHWGSKAGQGGRCLHRPRIVSDEARPELLGQRRQGCRSRQRSRSAGLQGPDQDRRCAQGQAKRVVRQAPSVPLQAFPGLPR